jgi:rhomboid protease GluP
MSTPAQRLIWALLAEGRGTLRELTGPTAHLELASGEHVVLLAPMMRVEDVLRDHKPQVLHLVTAGGDVELARRVAAEAHPAYRSRKVGYHHLADDGTITHLAGDRLIPLENVRLDVGPTEEMLAQLRAAQQPLEDQVHLARAIGRRFPWVTLGIAVSCIGMFILAKHFDHGSYTEVVVRMGALTPGIKEGEIWRLFAAAFLHGNVVHLIVNMIALLAFGIALERLLGPSRYVILYALSALGGSLASSLLRPVIGVGASGAIWGLMGAGIAMAYRPRELLPAIAAREARRTALVPLVINVLYSFKAGIDMLAHFGGGLVGFVLMFGGVITRGVTPLWRPGTRPARDPLTVRVAAMVLALAMLGSVAAAMLLGKPWDVGGAGELVEVRVGETDLLLEVPRQLTERHGETKDGEVIVYNFGALDSLPIAIEVVVTPRASGLVLDDATLAKLRDELDKLEKAGWKKLSDATERTIGGHRFVEIRHRIADGVELHSIATVSGERVLLVRSYTRTPTPEGWAGAGERILDHLRFAPP